VNDHDHTEIRPNSGASIAVGTEERVATAMRSLAAAHTPNLQPANPSTVGSRRWMLAVAASAVLIVGVGALLLATNRDTDSSADQLPQPAPTTQPAEPVDTESVPPQAVPSIYSTAPLGEDLVAVVVPAPAEPIRGLQLGLTDWVTGIDNGTTFVVLEDGQVIGAMLAFDSPAPWDKISEDKVVVEIDGRAAVRLDGSDERGFFVEIDGGTRAVLDTSPPSQALGIDTDIADLMQLLGDEPLDRFDDTSRFVRLPLESTGGRSVSYGTDSTVQLIQLILEPDVGSEGFTLIADAYERLLAQSDTFQISQVVQVSPVDLILVIARNEDDLDAAVRDLQLVPFDESGVDFATYAAFAGDEIVARGQPDWGRWQVTADANGGDDCRLFQARVWDLTGVGRGYTDCGERNPVRADGSQVYCEVLDIEIVGAVVGETGAAPTIEIGPDIDGLRAEVEDTTSTEFGESTTFRIVQTEPGANIRSATVLVDGVEIDCRV